MRLLSLWTVVAYLRTAPNANAQPMFMGIGDLPGSTFESRASAVSADGLVVVGGGRSASGREAFRWTASGGMVGLGDLPGGPVNQRFWSQATETSSDGSLVVGLATSESGIEAFVWDSTHGMRELDQILTGLGLDLTGWWLESATGISADGRVIVGTGTNPNGDYEAWIATLPEPSAGLPALAPVSLGLLGGLLALVGAARAVGLRRRRRG